MTALAGLAYLLFAFSPALAIFHKIIANDPLRIILFVLGAFFWLLSLLFSALVWYAVIPLRDTLVFAVFVSIAFQEIARLIHFILLKKAQKGLSRMAASGMHISGVHTLHHARHILAIVCGLGMGVMAALFLVVNVIADFWGEGTVGLPATVPDVAERFDVKLTSKDEYFPLTYSMSACILTLCHMFWTILFWDGCHKKGQQTTTWWTGILCAVVSHYAVSGLSFWNRRGFHIQLAVLSAQLVVLVLNAIYSCYVMGITGEMLRQIPHQAASRMQKFFCCKRGTPSSDTLHVAADESAPNRSLNTTINDDVNRNSNIAITDQGPVRARAQDQNQSPRTVNA